MTTQRKRALQKQLFGFAGPKQPAAQKALSLARKNRRKLNEFVEIGYVAITSPVTGTLNATPAVTELQFSPEEGTKCMLKSVRVKGWIKQQTASLLLDDYRVDIVLDRSPRGALPTASDIYGVAAPTINVMKGTGDFRRFKILRTIRGILEKAEIAAGGASGSVLFDFYVKLNLVQLTQAPGNFAIANLTKNAVSIVLWTTATANQPTFSLNHALTFVDD